MSTKHRFTLACAVFVILAKEGKVLLQRRYNTGWEDGSYGLPSGHLEDGETAREAARREASEEIGVDIPLDGLRFVHLTHHTSDRAYMYVYFAADTWNGEPRNNEPEKCDELIWANPNNLPGKIVPGLEEALRGYATGNYYSEDGWEAPPRDKADLPLI